MDEATEPSTTVDDGESRGIDTIIARHCNIDDPLAFLVNFRRRFAELSCEYDQGDRVDVAYDDLYQLLRVAELSYEQATPRG